MTEYFYAPGWEAGFEERGMNIVAWETFGDWQGDYAVVFKANDNLFAFDVIGYGSCSGCDSMEACETEKEYKELISGVVNRLQWLSADQTIDRINNEFDDNNWYRHEPTFKESIGRLVKAIKND